MHPKAADTESAGAATVAEREATRFNAYIKLYGTVLEASFVLYRHCSAPAPANFKTVALASPTMSDTLLSYY